MGNIVSLALAQLRDGLTEDNDLLHTPDLEVDPRSRFHLIDPAIRLELYRQIMGPRVVPVRTVPGIVQRIEPAGSDEIASMMVLSSEFRYEEKQYYSYEHAFAGAMGEGFLFDFCRDTLLFNNGLAFHAFTNPRVRLDIDGRAHRRELERISTKIRWIAIRGRLRTFAFQDFARFSNLEVIWLQTTYQNASGRYLGSSNNGEGTERSEREYFRHQLGLGLGIPQDQAATTRFRVPRIVYLTPEEFEVAERLNHGRLPLPPLPAESERKVLARASQTTNGEREREDGLREGRGEAAAGAAPQANEKGARYEQEWKGTQIEKISEKCEKQKQKQTIAQGKQSRADNQTHENRDDPERLSPPPIQDLCIIWGG
jgi:hypothetical protein